MADEGDWMLARNAVLVRQEQPPGGRADAEQRQKVAGDDAGTDLPRVRTPAQVDEGRRQIRGDAGERMRLVAHGRVIDPGTRSTAWRLEISGVPLDKDLAQ